AAATPAATASGTGSLSIDARDVTIAAGSADFALAGFGQTSIAARESLIGSGAGKLPRDGALSLTAGRITAEAGSSLALAASGDVTISQPAMAPAFSRALEGGGHFSISGASVAQGGRFDLPSGTLALTASSGNLTLSAGSVINLGGYTRRFADKEVFGPAGVVALSAAAGDVIIAPGAVLDVSNPRAGDAGTIRVSAPLGTLSGTGTLAGAAAAGYQGGGFSADVGTLPDLAALNAALNAGGFTQSRQLRVRAGDLALAAGETMRAHEVKLVTDTGHIAIAGTIDASGPAGGGRIELAAGSSLTLAEGSVLTAAGTSTGIGAADAFADGGLVRVENRDYAGRLVFASGATIDVSAGAKGNGGRVEFITPRNPGVNTDTTLHADFLGHVVANIAQADAYPGEIAVIANKVHNVAPGVIDVNATSSNPIWNDYASFMTSPGYATTQSAIAASLGANVSLRAGVELQSTGNLTLASAWDLTNPAGWYLNNQPGLLTMRSGGTLDIRAALGLPNPAAPSSQTALFAPESVPNAPS